MTVDESRKVAQSYYRAVISGRPLATAAKRAGVSVVTLWRHAQLWPEIPLALRETWHLRPWERAKLDEIIERMGLCRQKN